MGNDDIDHSRCKYRMKHGENTKKEHKERTQTGATAAEAVCDSHLLCPTGQTTEPEDQQQWQFNFVGSTCKRERVLELCCYFSFGPTCL